MAIVIRQNESDVKLAFDVHRHAEIVKIRLASASMRAEDFRDTSEQNLQIRFAYESAHKPAQVGVLRIQVKFRMQGSVKQDSETSREKAKAAVKVECIFEADYSLKPEFEITPEHIRAFREGNAIFNLWPYFREFLQSHVTAMALPPFVAPFLRIQPKLPAPTPEARSRKKS